jgi:hypothetical protein
MCQRPLLTGYGCSQPKRIILRLLALISGCGLAGYFIRAPLDGVACALDSIAEAGGDAA